MITLERLNKVYAGEGQPALDNIFLSVPDGAIYGIPGRSGAGPGDLAIRYGYQRFNNQVMIGTVVVLIVMVQLVQSVDDRLVRRLAHRR